MSPLSTPSPARTEPRLTPLSTGSRQQYWTDVDPARLAAQEARIRARMAQRRPSASTVASSSPTPTPFGDKKATSSSRHDTINTEHLSPNTVILNDHSEIKRKSSTTSLTSFDIGMRRMSVEPVKTHSTYPKRWSSQNTMHPNESSLERDTLPSEDNVTGFELWNSYLADPYKSPSIGSNSPCPMPGSLRASSASPYRQNMILGGSPRVRSLGRKTSFAYEAATDSSPALLRVSNLRDLDEASKILGKMSRRMSGSSFRSATTNLSVHSERTAPLPRKLSGSPLQVDIASPTSSQERVDLTPHLGLPLTPTPQSALGKTSPLSAPPQSPLPTLPDKRERRKVRVRSTPTQGEAEVDGWEVDRPHESHLKQPVVGLGLGAIGLGSLPTNQRINAHSSLKKLSTPSPTLEPLLEERSQSRIMARKSGFSEIVDLYSSKSSQSTSHQDHSGSVAANDNMSNPKTTVQIQNVGANDTISLFDDAEEYMEDLLGSQTRHSQLILDFPLPPQRDPDTPRLADANHPLVDGSRPGSKSECRLVPRLVLSDQSLVIFFTDLRATRLQNVQNVKGNSVTSQLGDSHGMASVLKGQPSCEWSDSSQATTSSWIHLTPRSSIDQSANSALQDADEDDGLDIFLGDNMCSMNDMDDLISGDLEELIGAAENKSQVSLPKPPLQVSDAASFPASTSTKIPAGFATPDPPLHSTMKPRASPGRTLSPPGPDSAYWGEPEIMLTELDFSPRFDSPAARFTSPASGRTAQRELLKRSSQSPSTNSGPSVSLRPLFPASTTRSLSSSRQSTHHPHNNNTSKLPTVRGSRLTPKSPFQSPVFVRAHSNPPASNDMPASPSAVASAMLPLALSLSKGKTSAALRAGGSILKNVGRVGTAIAAAQYARPIWDRLADKSTPNYQGHIPLNTFENAFLAVGSGIIGVSDTKRGGEYTFF